MRHARALVLVLAMLLVATAQGGPPLVIGPTGVGISFGRGQVSGGVSLGFAPGFYAPVSYGYGSRYSTATIYGPPPTVVATRIIVNVPPPPEPVVSDLREEDYPDKIIIRPGKKTIVPREPNRPEQIPVIPAPMPAEPAAGVRPPKPEQAPPPIPKEPQPVDPLAPWWPQLPAAPDRPAPPANPNAPPAQQQIDLGKEAFSDPHREYARGEQRFQRAVETDPKNPLGYFYLAQSQFALGKYREAVANIHAGLRLHPVWPASKFSPRELYGPNAEDFTDHLRLLQESLARRPDDAALLFLYGYQLWFSGQEQEARRYFQRTLPLVAQPQFIQMFLQAGMGPVAAR